MSISFNAIEIFEIAERIERNSVNFYRKAAEAFSDESLCQLLLSLAEFEKEHEESYANMRKQISAKEWDLITFYPQLKGIVQWVCHLTQMKFLRWPNR